MGWRIPESELCVWEAGFRPSNGRKDNAFEKIWRGGIVTDAALERAAIQRFEKTLRQRADSEGE
jgi:hypothetical protein